MPQDRQERHLMRQRGAGTRRLDNTSFGFTFGAAAKQAQPTVSTAAAPPPSPTKNRTPSRIKSRLYKARGSRRSPSKKIPKHVKVSIPPPSKKSVGRPSSAALRRETRSGTADTAATAEERDDSGTIEAEADGPGAREDKGTAADSSRSSKTATRPPAGQAATSSVTGKRKRGKGLTKRIAIINEDDEDELGQGDIDLRFSPKPLKVRKRTPTADVKGARNGKGQQAIVHHKGNEAVDDGVDELESPGVLDRRMRKTKGGSGIIRKRTVSVMQDEDDCDEITSATNSVVQALSMQRSIARDRGKKRGDIADKGHQLVKDGNITGDAVTVPSKRKRPGRPPKVKSAKQYPLKQETATQTFSAEPPKPIRSRAPNRTQPEECDDDNLKSKIAARNASDSAQEKVITHSNEATDSEDVILFDRKQELKSSVPLKGTKSKQTQKKSKRKPLAPTLSPPNEIAQPSYQEDEASPPPKKRRGRPPKKTAQPKELTENKKAPFTNPVANQPRSDEKRSRERSTTSAIPHSITTETVQIPSPEPISATSYSQSENIVTTNVSTQPTSDTGTNAAERHSLSDSDYESDAAQAYHVKLSDRLFNLSVAIDVNEALCRDGHITSFEAKRLQQRTLDVRREKAEVEARIEEIRKRQGKEQDETGKEKKEVKERERLMMMMGDVRRAVKKGRVRARELRNGGGDSRMPLKKGPKAYLWENVRTVDADGRVGEQGEGLR